MTSQLSALAGGLSLKKAKSYYFNISAGSELVTTSFKLVLNWFRTGFWFNFKSSPKISQHAKWPKLKI